MSKTKKQAIDFEAHLKELTTLVEQMEKGDLKLNEALTTYERGISLAKQCQNALAQAEQTVKILSEDSKTLQNYEDHNDTLD